MLRRYELTDDEWNRVAPLLPPENSGKQGRPSKCNRTILNGIVLSLEAELTELSIDASIVKAHQHSAGAKKGGHQTKSDTAVVEPAQKSMQL